MKDSLTIRACQLQSEKNVFDNITKHVEELKKCSKGDVLVYPELFSSGYFMDKNHLKNNAISIMEKPFKRLLELSMEYEVNVIFPFIESVNGELFNSVAVINKEGKLLGIKRKSINWKSENGFISEDNIDKNMEVFEIEDVKFSILICYELSFPELSRIVRKKGAQVLLAVAFWGNYALNHWIHQLAARAIDNGLYVVGVNGIMADKTCGNTMAYNPDGEILGALGREEAVLKIDISISEMERNIKKWPYFSDFISYGLANK